MEETSFKGFSIFSSGNHFVQQSRTILAILVKGRKRNISMKFFLKSGHWPLRCCLQVFLFFSSGDHFIQQSGTIIAILVKGDKRNISVKSF